MAGTVLHCVAVCENVYDDWDPLFALCDPTGVCVAWCCCCAVLHCVKTCTITGTVLHCVALVALCQNVYDKWDPLFAWCYTTCRCVALCCTLLRCVATFTMTGTRSSPGVIPQVCMLHCFAVGCAVFKSLRWLGPAPRVVLYHRYVCCGVLRCVETCTMTGTRSSPGVIPQVCVLRFVLVALCCTAWKRVRWLALCCTALQCMKTCMMSGIVLHCVALCCTGCTVWKRLR